MSLFDIKRGKMMNSIRNLLVVLSIFLILLVFIGSASAVDTDGMDALSVDETADIVNEELALDSSSDISVDSNDINVLGNDEGNKTDYDILLEEINNQMAWGYIYVYIFKSW